MITDIPESRDLMYGRRDLGQQTHFKPYLAILRHFYGFVSRDFCEVTALHLSFCRWKKVNESPTRDLSQKI